MKLYIEPCSVYPLHELDITDWLAMERGYDTQASGTINIIYVTENAYCIELEDIPKYDDHRHYYYREWLPKSQCNIIERTGPKG